MAGEAPQVQGGQAGGAEGHERPSGEVEPEAKPQAQAPRPGDCLGCRLVGFGFGVGGGGYIAAALLQTPAPRGAHRATILVAAVAMAGLGVYRGLF
jgi:hypothetical protein